MQKKSEQRNFLGLEFLRFICALSVLVWHYRHFFIERSEQLISGFSITYAPYYSALKLFYEHGHFSVRIFWLISGFIFYWKYSKEIAEATINIRKFIILRLSRLYPLHLLSFLCVVLLQTVYFRQKNNYFVYSFNDIKHFILHVFFASSWGFQQGHSFNAPVWSVSIEILVYLAFFILIQRLKTSTKKTITTSFIFFLFYRFKFFNKTLFECGALFFYGGFIYQTYETFKALLTKKILLISSATLITILALVLLKIDFNLSPDYLTQHFSKTGFFILKYYLFIPLIVLPFLFFFEIPFANKIIKRISWLGNLTYSSYMIHFPIQLILVIITDYYGFNRDIYYSKIFFWIFIGITFLLSTLLFKKFEVPLQSKFRLLFFK